MYRGLTVFRHKRLYARVKALNLKDGTPRYIIHHLARGNATHP